MSKYKKCLVTFFDVLGFGRFVETSEHPDKVAAVLKKLQSASKPDPVNVEMFEMSHLSFSDTTVRTTHIKSRANRKVQTGILWHELNAIVFIQAELIRESILIRGSVTVGDILVASNLIFGPALVRAYKLESEFAVYPRILVDRRVFEFYDQSNLLKAGHHDHEYEKERFLKPLLRLDSDGLWFVDYLKYILDEFETKYEAGQFLANHRQVILTEGRKFKELDKVSAKFNWLAQYHNRVVREGTEEWYDQAGISQEELMITPKDMPLMYEF